MWLMVEIGCILSVSVAAVAADQGHICIDPATALAVIALIFELRRERGKSRKSEETHPKE